ncbi:succinate dehydrogenase, hydrophobic membrane anchor protein [Rhodoligotrophos defluvii]|uniref:succinate dehydrogenase, hydrophobic membrane anchor protein n=1 Tax=Rhodoligotrophos defluvii TaxID=2561934 RepID=UPI0010C968AF|nr:succinate dehydrogenase, hydrophobic membrane anchor protein [Rhodoligotrophos defluvii]
MRIRTPLARVRGLGAAHRGTDHWVWQRITAIANIPLVLFGAVTIVANIGATRAEMMAWVGHPLAAIALIALILSVTYHMRLGMQVIIEDYVHSEGLKVLALLANTFFSIAVALVSLFAIVSIAVSANLSQVPPAAVPAATAS